MGITPDEFRLAQGRHMSLSVVAGDNTKITAVSVTIYGIRGSGGASGQQPVQYRVMFNCEDIRSGLPTVWVLAPTDDQIRHVNIWRQSHAHCDLLRKDVPSLCWGNYGTAWSRVSPERRTLTALLEYIHQHLNSPNFNSPARSAS